MLITDVDHPNSVFVHQIGSSGRPTFPPDITSVAEDFLNKTFILDHLDRPSARELLAHPFITEALE